MLTAMFSTSASFKIQKNALTNVPKVDDAIASLPKDMVIPSKGDLVPKNPTNRKVEATLRAVSWLEDLKALTGRDQPNFTSIQHHSWQILQWML